MMLAIGERYRPFLEKSLIYQGFELLWLPDNPNLDPRLAAHSDLNILRREREIILSRGMQDDIVNKLTNRGYKLISALRPEGPVYPMDAGLCVCDTGRYLIANPNTMDPAVQALFADRILVPVKQGYAACGVCVADKESIVTSDEGMAAAAEAFGLEVLRIEAGHIKLPGFREVFIGGASICFDENTIGFVGELSSHPNGEDIKDFLARKGKTVLELKKGALLDIGSGITLP